MKPEPACRSALWSKVYILDVNHPSHMSGVRAAQSLQSVSVALNKIKLG